MTAEGFIHVLLNSNLKITVPGTQKVDRYQNLHMGKKVRQQRKVAYPDASYAKCTYFLIVLVFYNYQF